ncbi:MAG: PfkB family carbohydrate kinase [Ignisphaera sp.]|uniref:Carbohydrate kinase PfkB domain-containing protein n=1 Tax=Ignisphaera aggregans TaxID=334771 RepID=A0A7C4D3C1_9CREN
MFMVRYMTIYVAGRINIDIFIEIDGILSRGRKYRGRILFTDVGGTAANIATSIARIDKNLKPKLLGAVGRDYEQFVYEKLGLEGIDLQHLKVLEGETGKAYIFMEPGGESTIITLPGVNDLYEEHYVPNRIDDAKALAICNTTRSVAIKLIEMARITDIPIFIDPHNLWPDIVEFIKRTSRTCFYLPNEHELAIYAKVDVDNIFSIKKYSEEIGCSIIVKMGEKGAIGIHDSNVIKVSALPLEGLGLKVLSTAGCGDTFTGVFIAVYLKKQDVVEALKYATVAAGVKATRISSRASPSMNELLNVVEIVERRNLIDLKIMEI